MRQGRTEPDEDAAARPGGPARLGGGAGGADAPSPLDAALALRDADVLSMVRRALERRDVLLALQPVVDGQDTGRVAFHEGLLRVIDDTGRVIPAREFIRACEAHETGRLLDCVALDSGLAALAESPDMRLSVNMSARSIGYAPWRRILERAEAADPTLLERLIVEITESSAILLPEVTQSFMAELQLKGVAFAIDDFGQGYTSFRYLRDLDFDILKVAAEFAGDVADDPDNRVLYEALISIARHFDMLIVAEGVERPADAELLAALGADCLQGYLFGAPALRPGAAGRAAREAG